MQTSINSTRRLLLVLLAVSACLTSGAACAQEARAQREREALRRAQSALQQANAERDTLKAERDAARKAQTDADQAAKTAATRAAAAGRKELLSLRADLERGASERKAEAERHVQALAAAQSSAAEREDALRREISAARRGRDERGQANAALAAMLAQRSEALADAQTRVNTLHTLGLEAVERYRNKGPREAALQGDPFLGLTAVRIENVADELRTRIDAQRKPPR